MYTHFGLTLCAPDLASMRGMKPRQVFQSKLFGRGSSDFQKCALMAKASRSHKAVAHIELDDLRYRQPELLQRRPRTCASQCIRQLSGKAALSIADGKVGVPTWIRSTGKYKLPREQMQGRTQIVHDVADHRAPARIRLLLDSPTDWDILAVRFILANRLKKALG